jgi:hypothetical protein
VPWQRGNTGVPVVVGNLKGKQPKITAEMRGKQFSGLLRPQRAPWRPESDGTAMHQFGWLLSRQRTGSSKRLLGISDERFRTWWAVKIGTGAITIVNMEAQPFNGTYEQHLEDFGCNSQSASGLLRSDRITAMKNSTSQSCVVLNLLPKGGSGSLTSVRPEIE